MSIVTGEMAASEAPATVVAIQEEALDYLVANLKTDQFWTCVASAVFLVAPFFGINSWGYVLGACGFGLVLFRTLAFRHYRRGDVTGGLLIVIAGTWASTIWIVWIVPEALGITMVSILGPIMLSTLYLPARLVSRVIGAGVLVAFVNAALAFGQDGARFQDDVASWAFNTTLVIYLAAHVLLWTIDARESNRIRQATVERLVAANVDLRQADTLLRESRRRLVVAGDQERVRIERNLHDGAQQRLVALAMQLNLSRQMAEKGTAPTAESLGDFHAAALDAVEELRELAQGVYPAVLAERGLTDALRAVARRSAQTVTVEGPDRIDLPADDAAAVYFVCLEAIQNAAKHAPATTVAVTIESQDGDLDVEVRDDGPGFDADRVRTSRGMANMRDRIAALGGTLSVDSTPGAGARVHLRVPRRRV